MLARPLALAFEGRRDAPSAASRVAASAYTLTQSSVPLGRTKLLPPSTLATASSIASWTPSGRSSLRSASLVTNWVRSATRTLTRRFG